MFEKLVDAQAEGREHEDSVRFELFETLTTMSTILSRVLVTKTWVWIDSRFIS
jgi:hypothetical protein